MPAERGGSAAWPVARRRQVRKSVIYQKAAYDAHLRGKAALTDGDITGAIVEDDEAADLALTVMLLRMRERAIQAENE
jgi:hypothetical protein